jgi:hypothetical protein
VIRSNQVRVQTTRPTSVVEFNRSCNVHVVSNSTLGAVQTMYTVTETGEPLTNVSFCERDNRIGNLLQVVSDPASRGVPEAGVGYPPFAVAPRYRAA